MISPTELLKMRHARALAELQAATAEANHELDRGGWRGNWRLVFDACIEEMRSIELQIAAGDKP